MLIIGGNQVGGQKMYFASIKTCNWYAIRKDDRPHWEVMADDGMNKFLKFCIFCLFAFFSYHVIIALIDRLAG